MRVKIVSVSLISLVALVFTSCGINSSLMLKTDKDYEFAPIDSMNETKGDYVIDVNDIVQMRFFTNDGLKVLDISSATEGGQQAQVFNPNNTLSYVIQSDSMVRLPVLGLTNIVGLTIREAEIRLQSMYSEYYVNPFIQLTVTNKRVVVFPGDGGAAQVIYLQNNNTTLMEVIGLAGGLADRGRASRIKLMRKDDEGNRLVYKFDLSTIEGLRYTDFVVQANDYIYVEPVPELGKEILQEVTPIVSLITSAAVIISVLTL